MTRLKDPNSAPIYPAPINPGPIYPDRALSYLGTVPQHMIHQNEGEHGFDDWCRTNAE